MLMNEVVMSNYAYLQLQIWNGPLEDIRKPVHPRNNNSEVGPRAGCSEVLRDGGGPTTGPPCPAEGFAGRWLGVPVGWVQAVHSAWIVCMCAYACMCVCCMCVCGLYVC